MARKVDVMRAQMKAANSGIKDPAPIVGDNTKKERESSWLIAFFTVFIVMFLLYAVYEPGVKRWSTLGGWLILAVHIPIGYNIYRAIRYKEGVHWATKVVIFGFVAFMSIAWLIPTKTEEAVQETRKLVNDYDNGVSSPPIVPAIHNKEDRIWTPKQNIVISETGEFTKLPRISAGFEANIYCEGGMMVVYWRGGPTDGQEMLCGTEIGQDLSALEIYVRLLTKEEFRQHKVEPLKGPLIVTVETTKKVKL